jgi:hypothetical protein
VVGARADAESKKLCLATLAQLGYYKRVEG